MSSGLYSGVSGLALGIGLYRNVSGLWGGASGLIDGFGGSDPYSGASLYLNFLNPVLDPRIDFSRGTNATLIDSTGKLTYAPNNLATWSEDFSNAVWTSSSAGVTVATDATVAPNGTTTADKLAETATTDTHRRGFAISSLARAQYVFSVYAKAAERTILRGWSFSGGDTNEQTFNLANGTCTGSLNPIITPVGNGWYRCSFTVPAANAGSVVFGPSDGTGGTNAYPGVAGFGIFVWGAQLEAVTYQTTPSTYVATTASAYYGPRFDYDPVTLAPRGLLIEEARTNLLTYSQDWTNAAWSKANVTVTAAATTSPDGAVNAQRLQATTTAATNVSSPAIAVAATSASYSVYVKQGSGATTANTFALRNNTTATNLVLGTLNYSTGVWTYTIGSTGVTVANAGNGWWRLQITATSGITSGDTLIVYAGFIGNAQTAGDHLFVYGAQLEAGSFATSYIPTVASTVTRNADVATMTGTNFSSWFNATEGTFIAEADYNGAANFPYIAGLISQNGFFVGSTGNINTGRVFSFDAATSNTTPANTVFKAAGAYNAINPAIANLNGGPVATGTEAWAAGAVALRIGGNTIGGRLLNGHIRTIAYFNTRLPNAQLQTLTAPSLATTLSLDFTTGSYNVGF